MQPADRPSFLLLNARGLIVVAVLVIILIVVLVVQFAGGAAASLPDGNDTAAENQDRKPLAPPNGAVRETRKPPDRRDSPDPWLPISLDQVIGHDPFRIQPVPVEEEPVRPSLEEEAEDEEDDAEEVAAKLRQQTEAARQAALVALTEQGVGALMSGGKDGDVAVIGDRTVRVGDLIDGFRVIAVGPDGMIVEPVD